MKRRGFLGMLGGAVVAGPGAAKQAVTAASKTGTGGVASLGIGAPNGLSDPPEGISVGGSHKTYLKKRVADIRRRLRGELTDEEAAYKKLNDETVLTAFEIETSGIRSMSETSKLRRMRRYSREYHERQEAGYAQIDLSRALKELAGLE